MNKLVKLPLFLGAVGCICGGVLAAVNFITEPVIAANEEKKANAAFYEHFSNFSKKNVVTVKDELASAGITQKFYCFDESLTFIGTVYECSVVGFAGKNTPIKFTVSFANGAPLETVELPSSVTVLNLYGLPVLTLSGIVFDNNDYSSVTDLTIDNCRELTKS